MLMLCFLAAVERKPRTLWACQSVAFMISVRVAPLDRPISSRIFAPLLSGRGVLALAGRGLVAFLPALACFFGAVALVLPLAVFRPLGAPFFWLVPFFEEAFSGATVAPCSATLAAVLASALVMVVFSILFGAQLAHDDSSLWSA